MRRLALSLSLLLLSSVAWAQEKPAQPVPDPFGPIRFMVGTWKGENTGEPGYGTSDRTYAFEYGERFMTTRNTAVYPPQPKNEKGETHRDMGVISYDKARRLLVFRQFHSDGFVNQYAQDTAAGSADTVVFVSEAIENIAPGWRAKESYRKTGPDTMVETFELTAPGKPFEIYSECRLTRVKAARVRAVGLELLLLQRRSCGLRQTQLLADPVDIDADQVVQAGLLPPRKLRQQGLQALTSDGRLRRLPRRQIAQRQHLLVEPESPVPPVHLGHVRAAFRRVDERRFGALRSPAAVRSLRGVPERVDRLDRLTKIEDIAPEALLDHPPYLLRPLG
jgi:hypothetical protein